jgi:hypothetical protein
MPNPPLTDVSLFLRALLGNVGELVAAGTPINGAQFTAHPAQQICKLPGGQIYYEVGALNVDDDGGSAGSPPNWETHPVRGGKIDTSHQNQTSYGGMLPKVPNESDPISAFNEPYIVLPGVHSRWFREQGLHVGDGAIVIKGNQKMLPSSRMWDRTRTLERCPSRVTSSSDSKPSSRAYERVATPMASRCATPPRRSC